MFEAIKIGDVVFWDKEDKKDFNHLSPFFNFIDYSDDIKYTPPTLFVGFQCIKGVDFDIFSKTIQNGFWWTYTKSEKITDFFDMIGTYPDILYNYLGTQYKYFPFNFNFIPTLSVPDVKDFLINTEFENIYLTDRSAYFLLKNKIFSIDFYYFGFIDKSFVSEIKKDVLSKRHIYDKGEILLTKTQDVFKGYSLGIERYMVLLWK